MINQYALNKWKLTLKSEPGMASGNEELYEDLRVVLFSDNAVAGEAAGLAMGLVPSTPLIT